MEQKIKLIDRINTYSIILLFISIFLEDKSIIFKGIYILTGCLIYVCVLVRNKLKVGKLNPMLLVLCSLSVGWVILRVFYTSPYLNIFGLVLVYSFLLLSGKSTTGQWNKLLLLLAPISVVSSILRIYFDSAILTWIIVFLQIAVIIYYLDPILEKAALKHRAERLAKEEEEKQKEMIQTEV